MCFFSWQFNVLNTLGDQILEDVKMAVEPAGGFKIVKEIPIPKLAHGESGQNYVVMEYPEDVFASVGQFLKMKNMRNIVIIAQRLHQSIVSVISESFGATLKFMVKDCDPTTGLPDSDYGYMDEYMVRGY